MCEWRQPVSALEPSNLTIARSLILDYREIVRFHHPLTVAPQSQETIICNHGLCLTLGAAATLQELW